MKKTRLLCSILLTLLAVSLLAACTEKDPDTADTALTSAEETKPSDPDENLPILEQWVAGEMEFTSQTTYEDPLYDAALDVVFTNAETGTTFTMPAFWDGGTSWKVRYALTELGKWTWSTICTDETNTGLHGQSGVIRCVAYGGELDIYKHGFIKTEAGTRYFMYADGTPFFYLGDTHFTLPLESIDGINPEGCVDYIKISQETADEYGITSMFRYIMDYRAEQGYTVIQSQQLGYYMGVSGNSWMGDAEGTIFTHGVSDMILAKFRELDRYFAYIAEKGFVHAHTQFSYPEELIELYLAGGIDQATIDTLCRYWVARYAAYPVMWTTAQEGDKDHYGFNGCTPETNPWSMVMESIAKYDPYDHPSSCHMENSSVTAFDDFIFDDLESHSWYAAQYNMNITDTPNWDMLEEFWNKSDAKPVVNYEGQYDHFWCNTAKARAQGWMAFLNGQVGYGYGSQPIWSIFWGGNESNTVNSDERGEFSIALTWLEGLHSEAGQQMVYMKDFLEDYEWWKLVPNFQVTSDTYFTRASDQRYSVATVENKLFIGYFYGEITRNKPLGTLQKMENADYEVVWMNCVTGERTEPIVVTITDGTYQIPKKPTSDDWVVAVKLIED
ncbi:MAG: DUF4038 domain-containing protein [Ruminococcaceae bacterium]|nr:DUF4038 domain-containing protein [Oscillospiraceae bacterium]